MLSLGRNAMNTRKRQRTNGSDEDAVLGNVVACLSGYDAAEKEQLHALIVKLGGKYTRTLSTAANTHVIAKEAMGEKYAMARHNQMKIVSAAWLQACAAQHRHVPESEYRVEGHHQVECSSATEPLKESLMALLNDENRSTPTDLLAGCSLLLLGWSKNVDDVEKVQLGKLVRRHSGTIYWNLTDNITHMIVQDGMDEAVRGAARAVQQQHPNAPLFLSPAWIVASVQTGLLQKVTNGRFAPKYKAPSLEKPELSRMADTKLPPAQMAKPSQLFHGSIFCLLRMAPPNGAVDYDTTQRESTVTLHGGQMLCKALVDALHSDQQRHGTQFTKRPCYVLCWGGVVVSGGGDGGDWTARMSTHPLLVQGRNVCDLQLTTPLWLRTCVAMDKVTPPQRNVWMCFQPTKWPLCAFPTVPKQQPEGAIRISVTGFAGIKRAALTQLITLMGARYDDAMRTTTTHLICRQASGDKYTKALEWKLQVVTVDWLLHVAQHGYRTGGEAQFALPKDE